MNVVLNMMKGQMEEERRAVVAALEELSFIHVRLSAIMEKGLRHMGNHKELEEAVKILENS